MGESQSVSTARGFEHRREENHLVPEIYNHGPNSANHIQKRYPSFSSSPLRLQQLDCDLETRSGSLLNFQFAPQLELLSGSSSLEITESHRLGGETTTLHDQHD